MLPGCDAMSEAEWAAQVAQINASWNASGKSTLHGVCAVITAPNGGMTVRQQCRFPDGRASSKDIAFDSIPADGIAPCEDFWYNGICPTLKEGDQGFDKCQKTAPKECPTGEVWASWLTPPKCQPGQPASGKPVYACKSKTVPGSWDLYEPTGGFRGTQGDINVRFLRTVPSMQGYDAPNEVASISSPNFCALHSPEADSETQPAPEPAPESTPEPTPQPVNGNSTVPLSFDVQAFTPGGTGSIPTQPLMQPKPLVPAAQPARAPSAPLPEAPKDATKTLDTGSAIGIGTILVAIGAAAFFGGK